MLSVIIFLERQRIHQSGPRAGLFSFYLYDVINIPDFLLK
ncbi:hypothetical protein ENTCAN_08509 [Enterobacter cancerogenus ATCC 35316]|nr:hypothetical protein ENTCAN_08509 [Enterobacter cancerogenus ATCC 35316]